MHNVCIFNDLHPKILHADSFSILNNLLLNFYRYILTLSDQFSKWVEAVAVPTKEAHRVASALYYKVH